MSDQGREALAAAVHEAANALTGVMGWVDVARTVGDPAMQSRALALVARGVERARGLLATASDPQGIYRVQLRAIPIGALVRETCELLAPRCASLGVTLTVTVGDEAETAQALVDPDRCAQVVTNLVLNAVDAVQAAGATVTKPRGVRVDASATASAVTVSVGDDGTGMSGAMLAKVTREPGHTSHPREENGRRAGTGLGLAIVRRLVEAMHGTLTFSSDEGVGTVATIVLVRPADAAVRAGGETVLPAGTRVLVVDDDPAIRELLEVVLPLRGALVRTAATLDEARSLLAREPADVVLVDEMLGGDVSGAVLVRELERSPGGPACVLMTGTASIERLGSDVTRHLLRKPFEPGEAVLQMVAALGR